MSWVGLATVGRSVAKNGPQAEFDVAHAHDALDGFLAQLASQREDIGGHGPQVPVLRLHPVQLARLVL